MSFLGDLVGGFTGQNAKDSADAYAAQSAAARAQAKKTQYDLLNQMSGPTMTAQQSARLKALDAEANTPLEQDKNFQGNVRQVTQGGATSLSSIQNKQASNGTTGGFANQGSISDVYDRVGGQLADVAQQAQAVKDQKRDESAQGYQSFADAQTAYQNGIVAMKQAIESGDAQAAQAAMAQVAQAKAAASNQLFQNITGLGSLAVGAMTAGAGTKAVSAAANAGQGPTQAAANPFKPYWQM